MAKPLADDSTNDEAPETPHPTAAAQLLGGGPPKTPQPPETITLAEVLTARPPNQLFRVSDLWSATAGGGQTYRRDYLRLVCPEEECGGERIFQCTGWPSYPSSDVRTGYFEYACRNCGKGHKSFAVAVRCESKRGFGWVMKLGELPPFAPQVPSRVFELIGADRELFLQGRRCEFHGYGIGAFVYYRRVVDNQWKRLVSQIIKVAQRLDAPTEIVETLRRAESEDQFQKAVDRARDAIPESLHLRGNHNPLTLLYKALSRNLHEEDDKRCLELATTIRVVLTELADRISRALQDQKELEQAVSVLMQRDPPAST